MATIDIDVLIRILRDAETRAEEATERARVAGQYTDVMVLRGGQGAYQHLRELCEEIRDVNPKGVRAMIRRAVEGTDGQR